MPSSYTPNLGIELPADGELDGVWGDVVNGNMSILDRAINGSVSLSLSGTSSTLTTSDGTVSNGQYKLLVLDGAPSGTHTITIAPNDAQKIYFVLNTTAQSVVFTQGSGGNVTVPVGRGALVYADGGGASATVVDFSANLVPVLSNAGVTTTTAELNLVDGSVAGTIVNNKAVVYGPAGQVNATTLQIAGTSITSTPAELNLVDGSVAGTIVNNKAVVYGPAGQVNATTLQIAGTSITSTAAELNKLDGVTATTAELNFVDGVTSNIQTQLNAKAALASPALTGTPTAPTQALGNNSTRIATTAFVNAEITNNLAGFAAGAVGSYAILRDQSSDADTAFGGTLAGSNLFPAGFNAVGSSFEAWILQGATAVTGTWRCMGFSDYALRRQPATLWLRIS